MGKRRPGDIECEERMTGAIVAMTGFQYQVRVTVWMALDLMLRRRACSSIVVEPVDREDIEAVLRSAAGPEGEERGEARTVVGPPDSPLNVQVKRRAAHWTSGDFTSLMKADSAVTGPPANNRRTPPLVALRNPSTRYLLVTSSQATGDHLPSLLVPDFTAVPAEPRLPVDLKKAAQDLGLDPAQLAPRIAIMDMCSEELVTSRSRDLLMTYGHVPSTRVDACLGLLEQQVWSRLQGGHPGQWRREDLEEVICSREIGGRLRQPPELVDFVPPASLQTARERLRDLHAVLLLGMPGSGKSLTASFLTDEFRLEGAPFELVRDPTWLEVDERMLLPGRHLFVFEDPWGKYQRREGREGWASELLERLKRAGPDKKFILTSAWGLYPGPVTEKEQEKLAKFQVTLADKDYSIDARAEIARRRLVTTGTWQAGWLDEHIPELVRRTGNPLVLAEFVDQLSGIETREDADFEHLLAEAQHEKICERLAGEVRGQGQAAALGALVIWALLTAKGTVTDEAAGHLGRALTKALGGQEVQAVRVLRWLRDRRSLRERTAGYTAHPLFQKGLELAWGSDDFADVVEHARTGLVEELILEEDFEWAVTMLEALGPPARALIPARQAALDTWLRSCALEAQTPDSFSRSLYRLRAFSRGSDAVKKVADALLNVQRRQGLFMGAVRWGAPIWAGTPEQAQIAKDVFARQLAGRYVEWVLPFIDSPLSDYSHLPEFLRHFGWNLAPEYLRGLDSALAGATGAIRALVIGALLEGAPFQDVLMRCLRAYQAHELRWHERVPESDWGERVMDSMAEEHLSEQGSEEGWWLRNGLIAAIAWQRQQPEGWQWILTHPERESLIRHWVRSISDEGRDVAPDEFEALVELAEAHGQGDAVWEALPPNFALPVPLVEKWLVRLEAIPARPLKHFLRTVEKWLPRLKEIPARPLKHFLRPVEKWLVRLEAIPTRRLKHFLRTASQSYEPERLQASFSAALRHASSLRRIELVFSVLPRCWDKAGQEALEPLRRLVRQGTPGVVPIEVALQALEARDEEGLLRAVHGFDEEALALLRVAASSQQHTWAAIALLLLARAGVPLHEQAQALLHSPDKEARLYTGLALHSDPNARESVRALLRDSHYRCRRLAIAMLADSASAEERLEILKMHTDRSGPVRLEVAVTIDRLGWLEGRPILDALAKDTWDRSWYTHEEDGPDMAVRNAAEQALSRLGTRVDGAAAERQHVVLLTYLD